MESRDLSFLNMAGFLCNVNYWDFKPSSGTRSHQEGCRGRDSVPLAYLICGNAIVQEKGCFMPDVPRHLKIVESQENLFPSIQILVV